MILKIEVNINNKMNTTYSGKSKTFEVFFRQLNINVVLKLMSQIS